jgi:uncharacterized membrane protein
MSDEFYYLECAGRLAWGYVDHPPLSIAVLSLVKSTLGTSLLAMRVVPALLACLNVALGVVLGLGLLNKISLLWLGLGLAVGLVATSQRRWLLTPWPYACAAIALVIVSAAACERRSRPSGRS